MPPVTDTLKQEILGDKSIITDYIHPHSLNNGIPTEKILLPKTGGEFSVDDAVLDGKSSIEKANHLPPQRLRYRLGRKRC